VEVFQAEGAVPKPKSLVPRMPSATPKLSGERPARGPSATALSSAREKPQDPVEAAEPKNPLVVLEDLMHETLGAPWHSRGSDAAAGDAHEAVYGARPQVSWSPQDAADGTVRRFPAHAQRGKESAVANWLDTRLASHPTASRRGPPP